MSFTMLSLWICVTTLVVRVSCHGFVQGISVGGVWYPGYQPVFQYQKTAPIVAGWSDPQNIDNGFVSDYSSPDIACHKAATPGQTYINVGAGESVTLLWTTWPESHHGPMLDYLANCNGECTSVEKTSLLWNKIDEAGLIDDSTLPGKWASDQMIASNNSWTVTIPSTIAPGNYVLRHETIALHNANNFGGTQNYPQCINLKITGSGTDSLSTGTPYNKLYTESDPGIFVNIYTKLSSYALPGPALMGKGGSGGRLSTVNPSATSALSSAYPSSTPGTTTGTPLVASSSSRSGFSYSTYRPNRATTFQTVTMPTRSPANNVLDASTSDLTVATTAPIAAAVSPDSVGSVTSTVTATVEATATLTGVSTVSTETGKSHRFVCYEETD